MKVFTDIRMRDPLFIGIYPTGIVYADKRIEKNGDYKKIAFLPYDTLELEVYCSSDLIQRIQDDAQGMIKRKGERYPISTSGQCVILGSKAK